MTEELCLRFLSGRLQGKELSLQGRSAVLVGRTDVADLLLLDGMVSREHAKFSVDAGQMVVEDLGSTNGTFVNGERVRGVRVVERGDRVLIGTSIIKVAEHGLDMSDAPPTPRREELDRVGAPEHSGELSTTSVPELLNLMSEQRLDGTLRLWGKSQEGSIHVTAGVVGGAAITDLPQGSAYKCVLRMLGWSDGRYSIVPPSGASPMAVSFAVAELVVDGLFKLDEWEVLMQRLPARLCLARPITSPIRELSDAELDLLQAVHNFELTTKVVDSMVDADHRLASQLLDLLDSGFIRPSLGTDEGY